MGDAAVGLVSGTVYTASIDMPENKEFVQKFQQKYNRRPGQVDYLRYLGGLVARAAIAAVKGNVEGTQAFLRAIESARVEAPARSFASYPESRGPGHRVDVCPVTKASDGGFDDELHQTISNVVTFM
jgi:branched-chain amino acid transport system substrate-binding protein